MQDSSLMSLKDASKYLFITPQALSYAYRSKKIKAIKSDCHPKFYQKDLDNYKKNKWCRKNFYKDKYMTPKEAAEALKTNLNHIYYLLNKGRVEYTRKGCAYMIDRKRFCEKYLHT